MNWGIIVVLRGGWVDFNNNNGHIGLWQHQEKATWYSGANVDYRDGGGRVGGHHHDVGGGGCGRGVG